MITDKDREDLIEDIRAYNDGWMLEEGKDRDRLIEFENVIRTESADQARKEAADRVVSAWREHGEDITLRTLRSAIIGESATDHIVDANKKDDHIPDIGKKLAIAVKALEEIRDGDLQHNKIACDALKEIQG